MNTISQKSVLLAMSGGVDSSVAMKLLKDKGFYVVGVHMLYWSENNFSENETSNKCCSIESAQIARNIANSYDAPFYVVDCKEEFKKRVVDDFLANYSKCMTPNPCVRCNKYIKFEHLFELAKKYGCDYVATGHYARIKPNDADKNELCLQRSKDLSKDQTYFLYTLTQSQLGKIIFPIGDFEKEDIKIMAEEAGFEVFKAKKESQGVCFYSGKKIRPFLERNLPAESVKAGEIVDLKGKVVGSHEGLPFYTIGQRKGIRVGGEEEPWVVVGMNIEKNELIVGKDSDLYETCVEARDLHFINKKMQIQDECDVVIRYHAKPVKGIVKKIGDDKMTIGLCEPVRAIAKGQSVVFYDGDTVIGGGLIC